MQNESALTKVGQINNINKTNNNCLTPFMLSFIWWCITFGGMCLLPQLRGGARFCTRGAMLGYDGYFLILAFAKTVTPGGGPWREPG